MTIFIVKKKGKERFPDFHRRGGTRSGRKKRKGWGKLNGLIQLPITK